MAGGGNGLALAGALTELEKMDFEVMAVAGVGSGAMAAAMVSTRYPVKKCRDVFWGFPWDKKDAEEIIAIFNSFSSPRIPLKIFAFDLSTGTRILLQDEFIQSAVNKAMNMPFCFKTSDYNGPIIDGSVLRRTFNPFDQTYPALCIKTINNTPADSQFKYATDRDIFSTIFESMAAESDLHNECPEPPGVTTIEIPIFGARGTDYEKDEETKQFLFNAGQSEVKTFFEECGTDVVTRNWERSLNNGSERRKTSHDRRIENTDSQEE